MDQVKWCLVNIPHGYSPLTSSVLSKCFWRITIPHYKLRFHFRADPKSYGLLRKGHSHPLDWGMWGRLCWAFGWFHFVSFLFGRDGRISQIFGGSEWGERYPREEEYCIPHITLWPLLSHSGCCSKTPHTGWLINKRYLFLTVPEAQGPRSGPGLGLSSRLMTDILSPHMAETGQESSLESLI